MFFDHKLEDPQQPKNDIVNFDQEDDEDEVEQEIQFTNGPQNQVRNQEVQSQVSKLKGSPQNSPQQQLEKPTQEAKQSIFGFQFDEMKEDSDNEQILEQRSIIELEEDIKSHKSQKKQKPKVRFQFEEEEKDQTTKQIPFPNLTKNNKAKQQQQVQTLFLYIPEPVFDLKGFLNTPIPRDHIMQCTIRRDKSGLNYFYPKYNIHISDNMRFILSAKKMALQKTSYYLLSMKDDEYDRKMPSFIGKIRQEIHPQLLIRSNFLGTEFVIYDGGENPAKTNYLDRLRTQLELVHFESNILSTRGPRKMTVTLPKLNENDEPIIFKPLSQTDGLVKETIKVKNSQKITQFINKIPVWNEKLQAFVLNFSGRVDKPSVKNFQLIQAGVEQDIILQFGRVGPQLFNLDFQHPFTPLQAFAVCITNFDSKLACE